MDDPRAQSETYNPWTVVHVVFHHLAEQGLHPVLGEAGDPGPPAAALLRGSGHRARRRGQPRGHRDVRAHLEQTAHAVFEDRVRRRCGRSRTPSVRPRLNVRPRRRRTVLLAITAPRCRADLRPARPRSADESPKRGQGSPEDPGAGLGAAVPRAGLPVRNRLHVPEGAEEGPAQAGPAVLLPDAGGEGPPGLRRLRRRDPRQHVPPGAGALAGVAEAVPAASSRCRRSPPPGRCRCCSGPCRTPSCTTARRSR